MDHSETCRSCENVTSCSLRLRPSGVGGGYPSTHVACRHYTCDLGMAEATRAVRKHLKTNGGQVVSRISFGSSHKPSGTRLIDVNGDILSEQDGEFFPTGQAIIISQVFSNWEIP